MKNTETKDYLAGLLEDIHVESEELLVELFRLTETDHQQEIDVIFDFTKKILSNKELQRDKNLMQFLGIQFELVRRLKTFDRVKYKC